VTQAAIDWTLSLADDEIFAVSEPPGFAYVPPKGSFNKSACTACGEYVFERYVRMRDGKPYCIPCSGYKTQIEKDNSKMGN
jgi:formylmethanofuran dehydrogenase subunit E